MSLLRSMLAALLLLMAVPPAAAETTFKIATVVPEGTNWMREMRAAGERIAERTGGRVNLRFFPGGVMGSEQTVLRKMRIGQLQGSAVTGGSLAQLYPDSQVYSLPLAFRSLDEVDYVRRHMDAMIEQGLREAGYVSFGLGGAGFAYLMSNQPIRGVDDLKGQKVWVPEGDRIAEAALKAVDVSPVSLPLTDVLTGLQTGLIDTVATSPTGAIALHWHTRVRYLTDLPLLYLYGALLLDSRAYERLPTGDREAVREELEGALGRVNRLSRQDNESARQALRDQGIDFVTPVPGERERWQLIEDRAMEDMARAGAFSSGALQTLRGHVADYRRRGGG